MAASSDIQDATVETPLLSKNDVVVVVGSADYKGRPAKRSKSGGWRAALFILVVEMAERFAYFGISGNLITYLTGSLGQSTATAAEIINAWSGTVQLLPILGAFVADSFLGRYRTIIIASVLYTLGNAFARIGRVFVKAARNWRTFSSSLSMEEEIGRSDSSAKLWFQEFRFLNKALVPSDAFREDETVCSISEVEEAKAILRLFPIWFSCLVYGIMTAQPPTLFTKQGLTMNRSISPTLDVPATALQCFSCVTMIVFIPVYDRILVPVTRAITILERIGTGLLVSCLSMLAVALVERKRLEIA